MRAPGTANGARWFDREQGEERLDYPAMNGRSVILQAVRKLGDAALEITARHGVALDQIDVIVPHQANANLLRALGKRLAIPDERMVMNVDRFGNTSGASAFLALHQERRAAAASGRARVDPRFRGGFHLGRGVVSSGAIAQRSALDGAEGSQR